VSTPQVARALPLWRAFITQMRADDRIGYGQFFSIEEMEDILSAKADSLEFAFGVARIRRALRREGKNFTSRGQGGKGYVIASLETNHVEMGRLQCAALTALREGVILGTTTPVELLSAEARRKHESVLERMANRLALINRRGLPPEARKLALPAPKPQPRKARV
jgi:hypothetical protein